MSEVLSTLEDGSEERQGEGESAHNCLGGCLRFAAQVAGKIHAAPFGRLERERGTYRETDRQIDNSGRVKESNRKKYIEKQRDRQPDGETVRQRDRQTDRQGDSQTERHTDRETDRETD